MFMLCHFSLVRWKPVLEPNYPSKITFWVRVLDVPMQFWVESTFKSVGAALGLVKGDVDLREGRVRVELDGFKPLVFSMDVDFDEGVELEVNLRYERLVGYCRICMCMTHDQSRCPTKVTEVEAQETENQKSEQGNQALSYKGALETVGVSSGDHGSGAELRSKGKGLARDRLGPYKESGSLRQGGAYRGYKGRNSRGFGDGSTSRGVQTSFGIPNDDQRRFAVNTRGIRQLENGKGDHLSNHQKLMMDAFKGMNKEPQSSHEAQENVMLPGARKSLTFEEPAAVIGMEEPGNNAGDTEGMEDQMVEENTVIDKADGNREEDGDQGSFPEDNTREEEGVLLSDSELIDEGWEEGEMADFLEEMVENIGNAEPMDQATNDITVVAPNEANDAGVKLTKKKGTKTGTRLVHKLLSPRKSKIIKPAGKVGEGKKAGNKP
ncbi:unnamed protein product [Eruca vesicaria subsp. sativa]|uniref:Zinc knuckle CX2CX4HX4C domain-containing protein n=1 Tax=Eruca vesicaria subsp. sativa TaxID=29727 RepID=A0ABC8K6U0_ERUVS|nr:unnamed protein product [Eruca vesicaria subsp. sativa]